MQLFKVLSQETKWKLYINLFVKHCEGESRGGLALTQKVRDLWTLTQC